MQTKTGSIRFNLPRRVPAVGVDIKTVYRRIAAMVFTMAIVSLILLKAKGLSVQRLWGPSRALIAEGLKDFSERAERAFQTFEQIRSKVRNEMECWLVGL